MTYHSVLNFIKEAKLNIGIINIGSLRFYGDWFGRPMDNFHRPKIVEYINENLIITFDDNYIVTIEKPESIVVEKRHFAVQRARSVRYEYGHYGLKSESPKYYLEYHIEDNWIIKKSGRLSDSNYRETKLETGNYAFEIC